MRKLKLLTAATAALMLSAAGAAQATTLVFDDFESYGATSQLNFTGFTSGLSVTDGTVDYVHEPEFGLSTPYGTGMVDLDGSTGDGGFLRTDSFNLVVGRTYTLEFDVSGNQRSGASDSWRMGFTTDAPVLFKNIEFNFGSGSFSHLAPDVVRSDIFVGRTSVPAGDPWKHYGLRFTAGSASQFSAFVGTFSADNVGPLIDNFSLSATNGVPEPATWGLMIAGFGLAGGALRRRKGAVEA